MKICDHCLQLDKSIHAEVEIKHHEPGRGLVNRNCIVCKQCHELLLDWMHLTKLPGRSS